MQLKLICPSIIVGLHGTDENATFYKHSGHHGNRVIVTHSELESNWIAKSIVRRFDLHPFLHDAASVDEANIHGLSLVSRGKIAELKCGQCRRRHRFNVIGKVPFDILVGTEFA
jgi:hypothetical protein